MKLFIGPKSWLLAGLVLTVSASAKDQGMSLFVSPDGDNARDGRSEAGAFATITRARDEIRKIKSTGGLPNGGVRVEILGGRYALRDSLEFTAADSGTAKAPVIYQSFGNQDVTLLGGRVLQASELTPVTDEAMRKRLDPAVRDNVLCASIEKLGLVNAGPFPEKFDDHGGLFELFWNGKRLPVSRWPNEGWTTMKAVVVNGDTKIPGSFEYRDDRPSRWVNNPNVWLKGQWRVGWEEPAIKVAKIDTAARTITFAKGISLGIGNKYTRPAGDGKEPWCALNLPEEIDTPGEWAIDFATRILYFWPPAGEGELSISQLDKPMVSLNGAAHLKFIGLTFECSMGDGIVMENINLNFGTEVQIAEALERRPEQGEHRARGRDGG